MLIKCRPNEYTSELINKPSSVENQWFFLLEEKSESIFLFPFWQYLENLHKNIYSSLEGLKNNVTYQSLRLIIVSNLKHSILDLVKRTLIWEFKLCSKNNKNITLRNFLISVASEHQLNLLFKKYPVLKVIFFNLINNHQNYVLSLISRIKSDLSDINSIFKLTDFNLQSYEAIGDAHRLGSRVAVIIFQKINSQNIKKIIYKPRAVILEKKFNNFIRFIKEINPAIDVKTMEIIDNVQYGWMEYIGHEPINPPFENNYYHKLGLLLGICYILGAQDIHYENLIACGADPIIIDLECLFSPPITKKQYDDKSFPSIFDTLIIPYKEGLYDFSVLLNHGNQKSFMDRFKIESDFISNAYVERIRENIVPSKNVLINGITNEAFSPSDYSKNIVDGYSSLLTCIIENKTKVLTYMLDHFLNLENRVIFRPTFVYNKLQIESYHPRLLSNIDYYIEYLSQLNNVNDNESYNLIYNDELFDLMNGDIPYFYTTTNNVCIKNSRLENTQYVCYDSGAKRVIDKINLLNKNYIVESIDQILSSLKGRYV